MSEKIRRIQERNVFFCNRIGVEYRIEKYHKVKGENVAKTSDRLRFEKALDGNCELYIDWDVLLVDLPVFNHKRPLIGAWNESSYDSFVLYNGNRPDIFQEFLKRVETKGLGLWYYPIMNDWLIKQIGAYPRELYRHYETGEWRKMEFYEGH